MTDLEFVPQLASAASNWTINTFQKYLSEDALIIRPAFQRNIVWNDEQRSFLVDSVLRGMPIPEIYVQTVTTADGKEEVTVIDGQQRIVAFLRFLADELRLSSSEELDPRWNHRTFSELSGELKQRFRSYELLVRKLPPSAEPVLREIFRRLNKNVEALWPQELRHAAYTGPFIVFVENVASSDIIEEFGTFSRMDYLRRRSDELIAEIANAVIAHAFPNKKEGLDELFLTYEKQGIPSAVYNELIARFGRTLAQLAPIASILRRTRYRNKSDFYSLFYALALNAERLPLDDTNTRLLADRLQDFSSLVNNLKREEAEERPVEPLLGNPFGPQALTYLRAVERAASDRLNRVRRNDALQEVLGPVIASGQVRAFDSQDLAWLESVADELSEDEDSDPLEVDREQVLKAVTSAD